MIFITAPFTGCSVSETVLWSVTSYRVSNCCPLLTLFMLSPVWSLLSFNLSFSSFPFVTNFQACLSLSFIQNIPVFTQPVLRGSHPWMHGGCYSHFHLIASLCSQWEVLKPVCSNFLRANQSGYSTSDPVNQSAVLTSTIILQCSPCLASIAVLSSPCTPWWICLLTSPVVEITGKPKITLHNSNNVRKVIFLVSSLFCPYCLLTIILRGLSLFFQQFIYPFSSQCRFPPQL